MTTPGLTEVLLSLILVAIAIGVSLWWKLPVAGDMAIGTVRAFIQLVAVGYALHFIFDLKSLWLIILAIMIMITVGAQAAAGRVKQLKGVYLIAFSAMVVGSLFTLAVMLGFGIITLEARFVIPLAGMIIGNSMNAAALAIDRLASDIRHSRLEIETSLALGKSWQYASGRFQRDAARTGMISILNFMKTAGIVALPGAMTGMILAGADPIDAVLLQVIVACMLLASNTIPAVVAVNLAVRKFFTRHHQLLHNV